MWLWWWLWQWRETLEMLLGWCGSIRNVENQKKEEGKGKSIFHDRESWPSRGRI